MTDILGIVYDFVQTFAKADGADAYTDEQIVRGFQNLASPPRTTEFCTLTLLSAIKQGTDWQCWTNTKKTDPEPFEQHLSVVMDQMVQIDMCSAEPQVLPQVTLERAQALQLIANSNVATDFFEKQSNGTMTCLYAEDVQNLSGFDDTKTYTARYMIRLHLGVKAHTSVENDYFTSVRVRPMALDGSNISTPGQVTVGEVDTITRNLSKEDK